MADRVTRPSNANAHPGLVDRNPTRRTREEILAGKQAKAADKARAERERRASIKRVAAIEKAARDRKRDMDQDADDPADPPTQASVRMTRKRPGDVVDGGGKHNAQGGTFIIHSRA
jgi:hypothetical protein